MTEQEVMQLVRERIHGQSQGQAARSFGVEQGYFSRMLRGCNKPSKNLLAALGLVAVVDYRRIAEVDGKAASVAKKPTKHKKIFRYGDWPVRVGR